MSIDRSAFSLTPEQQRAFNRLEKAYKDCKSLGVFFVNKYQELYAFDGKMVKDYGDYAMRPEGDHEVELHGRMPGTNSINLPSEWTDDSHIMGLTEKGYKHFMEFDGGEL